MIALSEEQLRRMTDAEIAEYERVVHLVNQMETPLSYMKAVSPHAHVYDHHKKLEEYVLALLEHRLYPDGIGPQAIRVEADVWVHPETGVQTCQWLAITMPPRHGKSFYVSDHLPAWYMTRFPDNEMILATYQGDFSEEWSDKARTHIKEHPEFGIEIDPKNDSKKRWKIKGRRGWFRAAGADGPVTGKGANLIIGDDLISNSKDAFSATMRKNLWNWYLTTFKTRRNKDGVGIMMFTRWHEDDLIGRCLSREKGEWFLLNLPALAFDTTDDEGYSVDPDTGERDHLCRRPGEALCPDMYAARSLLRIKSGEEKADDDVEGGEATFQAMYQGKPNIEGGGLIPSPVSRYRLVIQDGQKLGTYFIDLPDGSTKVVQEADCFRFSTSDWAFTKSTQSDYCVITIFDATKDGYLLVRAIYRDKKESPDHVEWFKKIHNDLAKPCKLAGIEDKLGGTALIQHLRREARLVVPIIPLKAESDKITRVITSGLGQKVKDGDIVFPYQAENLVEMESEMTKFPNATHDDTVDTLSSAIDMWRMAPAEKKAPNHGDTSMQARVDAKIKEMKKGGRKKHRRLPQIGR